MKRAPHIKMTERQYKKTKRKQFRVARKALNDLNRVACFLPDTAGRKVLDALNLIDRAYQTCKPWWKKA